MTATRLTCVDCQHLRRRTRATLPTDVHSVGLAKGMLRLRELELELSSREERIVQGGGPFDFQPTFNPWCARHSDVTARQWWACATKNADGYCMANTKRGQEEGAQDE